MDIKPITREEMYLAKAAGQDVSLPEPITRKEMFLAKMAGMEVETPSTFTRLERFANKAAVELNRSVIEPLEITENGTYTAPDGVDGYNPVTVNVDPTKITILREQQFDGFVWDESFGAYSSGFVSPAEFVLKSRETYHVIWDGAEYECTAFAFDFSGMSMVAIGNGTSMGLPGNDEPFLITYNIPGNGTQLFAIDNSDSHTVGIWQKAESGGGECADLRYVTFMSEDGTVELGKKAVATGDDCADPIARGVFSTPTKESTAQYNYTFYGWATTPNGAADSNWNKAVTEDRTVYANFVSAVRYYTITYYDSDGTTVLKTESLAYGAMPSYVPTKEGCSFIRWEPELAPIGGNASYTAQWQEKISFANSSWADIAKVCEAGEAANNFSVGDTREIVYNANTYLTAVIVGIGHDDLANGNGKAGISVVVIDSPVSGINWGGSTAAYPSSPVQSALMNTVLPNLESNLVSVMKAVSKTYDSKNTSANVSTSDITTFISKIWSPSLVELNVSDKTKFVSSSYTERIADLGTAYEYFKRLTGTTQVFASDFYTRNHMRLNSRYNGIYISASEYSATLKGGGSDNGTTSTRSLIFGFCI